MLLFEPLEDLLREFKKHSIAKAQETEDIVLIHTDTLEQTARFTTEYMGIVTVLLSKCTTTQMLIERYGRTTFPMDLLPLHDLLFVAAEAFAHVQPTRVSHTAFVSIAHWAERMAAEDLVHHFFRRRGIKVPKEDRTHLAKTVTAEQAFAYYVLDKAGETA